MISTLTKVDEAIMAEIGLEMELRRTNEVFVLFSLGSQFDHLIKLALDRLGVYCLVADPASITAEDVARLGPKGIILSGGPASAHAYEVPLDTAIFALEIPVLGICLGFQLWAAYLGHKVGEAEKKEFGVHELAIYSPESLLFEDVMSGTKVVQSHGDMIEPSARLQLLASTENAPVAAARYHYLWGVQFHPEVSDTVDGLQMLSNFCFKICGARDSFPAAEEAELKIRQLREQIGDKKVLLALSGGSDSSVVAYLLRQAVPKQIYAVYIKGIDRPDDEEYVKRFFGDEDWIDLRIIDATNQFLKVMEGQESMRDKRVSMRGVYKEVLEKMADITGAGFVAQGTLYTDISESGGGVATGARKAQIKLHHNTGLDFSLPELTPLDDCVKDTARQIGRDVGVPEELLIRHPFPGPGLVVRIEGEVTAEKLAIARQADGIYIDELRSAGLYESVWQAGAVVTQSFTSCTKGDEATTGVMLELWAVWSVNGFTAQFAELPWEFIRRVSQRLTNEIREIGEVTYRVSDKPPTTIEKG